MRWKKDFLKDASVCAYPGRKLTGENLRRLGNTARAPQIHLLPNSHCASVLGAQDFILGVNRVRLFFLPVLRKGAACRQGGIWGLGPQVI